MTVGWLVHQMHRMLYVSSVGLAWINSCSSRINPQRL
jgi:hypothetical protein